MSTEADAVLSRVRRDVEAAGGEPDWQARAEAAEAKLAAIADLPPLYIGTVAEGNAVVSRPSVLAIIGGEEEEGRG